MTGLEWTTDNFFAGLQVSMKDRIGLNRASNFADPADSQYDFDNNLNNESFLRIPPGTVNGYIPGMDGTFINPFSVDSSQNGITNKRYGRVSERLPQLTISTNRLQIGTMPLWYHMDLNAFNNLDKGLNIVSDKDNSYVHGFDLYQSLSNLMKFSDRFTLLTKAGVGFGIAEREDNRFNLGIPDNAKFPYLVDGQSISGTTEGLVFLDRDNFLVGTKKYSLKNVDPTFGYADIDTKFNARVTDALSLYVRYHAREGSKDSLGQFYENIGARKTMDDLYPFRNRENWLEGGANYNLLYPKLTANASWGTNLQGEGDITPYEALNFRGLSTNWSNQRNTVLLSGGMTQTERQMRDPTDPYQFRQDSTNYFASGRLCAGARALLHAPNGE